MSTPEPQVRHFEEIVPGTLATTEGDEGHSLAEDLRLLTDEAKALARAELAFQKSRAVYAGAESRTIALLLVAGLVLAFFAVMACVVGSVIALGPLLGLWGAMVAVTLVLVATSVACALLARSRLTNMLAIIADSRQQGGTN